jgi:Ni,Fe-hydrogenase maturation factor
MNSAAEFSKELERLVNSYNDLKIKYSKLEMTLNATRNSYNIQLKECMLTINSLEQEKTILVNSLNSIVPNENLSNISEPIENEIIEDAEKYMQQAIENIKAEMKVTEAAGVPFN